MGQRWVNWANCYWKCDHQSKKMMIWKLYNQSQRINKMLVKQFYILQNKHESNINFLKAICLAKYFWQSKFKCSTTSGLFCNCSYFISILFKVWIRENEAIHLIFKTIKFNLYTYLFANQFIQNYNIAFMILWFLTKKLF